jgi:hypothetical protein
MNSGMVAHAYNSSIQEAVVGGLRVQGQSRLHSKTLPQKTKTKRDYYEITAGSYDES